MIDDKYSFFSLMHKRAIDSKLAHLVKETKSEKLNTEKYKRSGNLHKMIDLCHSYSILLTDERLFITKPIIYNFTLNSIFSLQ